MPVIPIYGEDERPTSGSTRSVRDEGTVPIPAARWYATTYLKIAGALS